MQYVMIRDNRSMTVPTTALQVSDLSAITFPYTVNADHTHKSEAVTIVFDIKIGT